jgi:hypothetical protein
VQAGARHGTPAAKLLNVLKRSSSLLRLSRAAAVTALSPAAAARDLGSAAKAAPSAGVDPAGAPDF